ncbi:hypothetical protein ACX2C7_22885, partial [Enterobacter mori]
VNGIAKSIAKWTHSNFDEASFKKYVEDTHSSYIQSLRGKKSRGGGRKKMPEDKILAIKEMVSEGMSYREISKLENVSIGFISKHCK